MIVGIDDTGTVALGEEFYMAMVFIRPSQLDNLSVAFLRWEDLCRRKIKGRPKELKSTYLSEAMYKDFINEVMLNSAHPVYYRGYKIAVDQKMLDWGEKQKARYIAQYNDEIPKAAKDGRPKWAKQAITLTGWLKGTPNGMMIKMQVLNTALTDALNNAVGLSAAQGFDHELDDYRIMIDEGFIKDKGVTFWKEILRSNSISGSARKPMPWLDTWDDNHPFVKTFVEKTKDSGVLFKPEFSKRFNFHSSSDEAVVRIADVMAGILRKQYIEGWDDPILDKLKKKISEPGRGLTQYQFTENWDRPPLPNPYDIIRADE
jgi:hypothetical protein